MQRLSDAPSVGLGQLASATVRGIDARGIPSVVIGDGEETPATVAESVLSLETGDRVLLLLEPTSDRPPTIVSRILERVERDSGDRRVIEAERSLMLRCGDASIELHADGRVEIYGTHVESYAEGIHRIKGAKVRIN